MAHLKKRPVVILSLLGLLTLGVIVALTSTHTDAAGATSEPVGADSQGLSVLGPASEAARSGLSQDAKIWLGEVETGDFPPLQGQVTGLGTAHTATNGDFTVIGVGQDICLHKNVGVEVIGPNGCTDISRAEEGQVFMVVPGCGEDEVVGFMPDGISTLAVEPATSTPSGVIPVTSNVYAANLPPVKTVLSGKTASGETIVVVLPLDNTPENCF